MFSQELINHAVSYWRDIFEIKSLIFAYLAFPGIGDTDVELLGAELFAEYKMTEGVEGGIEIERIK